MPSLYIHIPFCSQACHYCDFHFSTNFSQKASMIASICEEIAMQKNFFWGNAEGNDLQTIYFGGGTPSVLEEAELNQIFTAIHTYFNVLPDAEITLEANPTDLTDAKLTALRTVGINRLSIGIQSFHKPHLAYLHRNHTADDAFACLERSRKAGFDKFSLDLIYGIPADSHAVWEEDMRLAVATGVNHISAYSLTIERDTVFGNWVRKGKMKMPDEEFQAIQMEMLMEFLPANGFEQYEISNFAKQNAYSHHNTHYWKKGAYLGIGPSAHSYSGQARQWNISQNAPYIKSIQQGILPAETEILTEKDHQNEYILTSLRTKWGCSLDIFAHSPTHQTTIDSLVKQALLQITNNVVYLTRQGKLLADGITEKLLF